MEPIWPQVERGAAAEEAGEPLLVVHEAAHR
jgi:hypothetical protein